MVSREATVVLCGLPVDGLEAILELRRRTELPFANDGPNNGAATDGRGEYDEDHNGSVGEAGSTKLTVVCAGRRSGRDVARQCNRVNRGGGWSVARGQLWASLRRRCGARRRS